MYYLLLHELCVQSTSKWSTIESINKENNQNPFRIHQETNTPDKTESESVTHWKKKPPNSMMKALLKRCYMPHFNSWHMQPSIISKLDSGELTFNRSYWNEKKNHTSAHGLSGIWMTFLFILCEWERRGDYGYSNGCHMFLLFRTVAVIAVDAIKYVFVSTWSYGARETNATTLYYQYYYFIVR